MARIITLTLSPAFDVHCSGEIIPGHENLVVKESSQAAGKGVNISRALMANGTESLALILLGKENGAEYQQMLSMDGLTARVFTTPGCIRENITIHSGNDFETRISFPGFTAEQEAVDKIESFLLEEADEGTFITMTGRVPDGISINRMKEMLRKLTAMSVKLIIDSRSFGMNDLLEMKPWMIKPNQEEISIYLKRDVNGLSEVTAEARKLHDAGIENVMVSLGREGALLACDEGIFTAIPPSVKVLSTIGAGDSTIAGFLSATITGKSPEEALRLAVANGTSACLTKGTFPPEISSVKRILSEVKITSFE